MGTRPGAVSICQISADKNGDAGKHADRMRGIDVTLITSESLVALVLGSDEVNGL